MQSLYVAALNATFEDCYRICAMGIASQAARNALRVFTNCTPWLTAFFTLNAAAMVLNNSTLFAKTERRCSHCGATPCCTLPTCSDLACLQSEFTGWHQKSIMQSRMTTVPVRLPTLMQFRRRAGPECSSHWHQACSIGSKDTLLVLATARSLPPPSLPTCN